MCLNIYFLTASREEADGEAFSRASEVC